jgi:DNA excision repair protein ERCC-4
MSVQTAHIIADDRERASGIVDRLKEFANIDLRIEHLLVGDFVVSGQIVFERKRADDFAASLINGRLFSQAARLVKQSLRSAFILEGNLEDWTRLGVRREALQGALLTLSLIFDVPVFRSVDPRETARLLVYASRQFSRLHRADPAYTHVVKAKRLKTRRLRLLQSLPGVGPDRARCLLEHFGDVRACLLATVDQMIEVPGVGQKTAEAICEVLCSTHPIPANQEERSEAGTQRLGTAHVLKTSRKAAK